MNGSSGTTENHQIQAGPPDNKTPPIEQAGVLAGEMAFFEVQDLFESEQDRQVRIPKIVVAADGTVLAFADSCRQLRRSKDGGKTWSPIHKVSPDISGNAIVDENSGDVMVVCARRGYLCRSHDHGRTWKKEVIVVKPNAIGHGSPDGVPVSTAALADGHI